MLGILFMILKIIGILLLVVLAVLVTVLAVVLLVPVRYRVTGTFREEIKKVEGRITWLFHLVSVPFCIDENGLDIRIKILGREKKQEKDKKEKKERAEKQKDSERETGVKNGERSAANARERLKENIQSTQNRTLPVLTQEPEEKNSSGYSIFEKISHKIEDIRERITQIFQDKVRFVKKCAEKIRIFLDKKEKIMDFFADEETRTAKTQIAKTVKKAVRHLRPVKLEARIRFGLDAPDETGKLYAALCVLYGIYGKALLLEPDFENAVFEGEFQMKGRIRLLNVIYYGISLYRNKKLKEFLELAKNL